MPGSHAARWHVGGDEQPGFELAADEFITSVTHEAIHHRNHIYAGAAQATLSVAQTYARHSFTHRRTCAFMPDVDHYACLFSKTMQR